MDVTPQYDMGGGGKRGSSPMSVASDDSLRGENLFYVLSREISY